MNLADFGRFSDPALLILSSLADGPKHGYSMMNDIEAMTGVRLGPGTLYGALTRLEGAGLIKALPAQDRRRPYRVDRQGRGGAPGATDLVAQTRFYGVETPGGLMNIRAWLIRLYPRPWRERYAAEFEALLEECLHSPLDVLDIALGALDAHLGFVVDMNWRLMDMVNRLRTAILLVFAGYIGFVLGGLSLYGLVDDSPAVPLMKTYPSLAAAWTSVQAGAVISLLAIVIGGLPLAFVVIRRAFTSSRRDLRWLLVPVLAFAAIAFYLVVFSALANTALVRGISADDFTPAKRWLLLGFISVFVLGALASTAAVWKVVSNTEATETAFSVLGRPTSIQLYRFAFPAAVVAAAGMLWMLLATLAFGWMSSSALPQWFAGDFGLLLINTTVSFAGTLAVMLISAAVAVVGAVRGLSSWRMGAAG